VIDWRERLIRDSRLDDGGGKSNWDLAPVRTLTQSSVFSSRRGYMFAIKSLEIRHLNWYSVHNRSIIRIHIILFSSDAPIRISRKCNRLTFAV
jgi:hypothetical protein